MKRSRINHVLLKVYLLLLWPTKLPIQWVPNGKRFGREVHYSPPFIAEVKYECICTLLLHP